MIHEGYKYRQDYIHGERMSWRCIRRHQGCKGSAVTLGSKLLKSSGHTHDEEDSSDGKS